MIWRFTTYFGEYKDKGMAETGKYKTYDGAIEAVLCGHKLRKSNRKCIYEIRDNEESISTYMDVDEKGLSIYSVIN